MVNPKDEKVELFQALTVEEVENRALHGLSGGILDSISDENHFKSSKV